MNAATTTNEHDEESDPPFKYRVSEMTGKRWSVFRAGFLKYAEARDYGRQLAERGERDKSFRIVDADGTTLAIARNGTVTNADGTGPDVDPDV
jgi:hypothetical protein